MPVASYSKFDNFVQDKARGNHKLGTDQLRLFLTNVSPVKSNAVIADITEIDYTNLGGDVAIDIPTTSANQIDGTFRLIVEDLILTAIGPVPTFRYIGIQNTQSTGVIGGLINWYDYGSAVTMALNETFTTDFDQVNGVHSEG